jgi:CO/xanthine dehydrogenase Mo-binding subunit
MVRHVGEAIAIIVGESRNQAEDAAELVTSDFEELPAVVDPEAALQPDTKPCSSSAAKICVLRRAYRSS